MYFGTKMSSYFHSKNCFYTRLQDLFFLFFFSLSENGMGLPRKHITLEETTRGIAKDTSQEKKDPTNSITEKKKIEKKMPKTSIREREQCLKSQFYL